MQLFTANDFENFRDAEAWEIAAWANGLLTERKDLLKANVINLDESIHVLEDLLSELTNAVNVTRDNKHKQEHPK